MRRPFLVDGPRPRRLSQGAAVAVAYAAMHPERVSQLVLYGGYAQGRLARDPSPRARKEAEIMQRLLELGWGRENPAFRQVFATMFMPEATPEQAAWLMDPENVSALADGSRQAVHAAGQARPRTPSASSGLPTRSTSSSSRRASRHPRS